MADEVQGGQGGSAQGSAEQQNIGGEQSSAAPVKEVVAKEVKGSEPKQPKEYIGSEKVNPKQKPLKTFERKGMTKEQIDAFILEAGRDIFLPEEAIATEKDKDLKVGKDGKEVKDKKGDKITDEDSEVQDFLEKTGLTKEEAESVPESVIGKIQKILENSGMSEKTHKEVAEKYTKIKSDTDTLINDAVVAARMEELATGKSFVATKISPVTENDVAQIETFLNEGNRTGAAEMMDKILKTRVGDAIKHERSVIDRRVFNEKLDNDAFSKVLELGKHDKRLFIKETDLSKISKPDHPEFKLAKDTIDFLIANDYSKEQIRKMDSRVLYASLAAAKGWDKEAAKNIAETTKKTLYEKLRQPAKANTLGVGQSSESQSESFGNSGFSKDQLIDQVSKGELKNWLRLSDLADAKGDNHMIRLLGQLRQAGEDKAKQNREEQ
jgi:hypothetical protein